MEKRSRNTLIIIIKQKDKKSDRQWMDRYIDGQMDRYAARDNCRSKDNGIHLDIDNSQVKVIKAGTIFSHCKIWSQRENPCV